MPYVTDAAREYKKKHTRDANIPELPIDFDVDEYIGPGSCIVQIYNIDEAIDLLNKQAEQYGFSETDAYGDAYTLDHIVDNFYLLNIDIMFETEAKKLLESVKSIYMISDKPDELEALIAELRKQSQNNEKIKPDDKIEYMAKIFFKFVQLHNKYVDAAYALDEKLNNYMKKHHIFHVDLVDIASYMNGIEHININDLDDAIELLEDYTSYEED